MKKKKKLLGISLIVITVSIIITEIVYALSFKFEVKANKTEAKAGEEIIVEMKIAEIEMGDLRNKCNRINTRI